MNVVRPGRPLAFQEGARGMPIVVGREADVASPGAFFTTDGLGIPLLVTRDLGGVVHAMVNACRHRGSRLVYDARGEAVSFICPSHAWQYDLCGVMGTTPLSHCAAGAPREDSALAALPCETRHGLVWVVPNRRAGIDVASFLGAKDAELAALLRAPHSAPEPAGEAETLMRIEPNAQLVRRADGNLALVTTFPQLDGSHVEQEHRLAPPR
jgi:phenylpropionate dioxygenase-like ring-hydroxylating dioxygenase large terminal subunit